MLLHELLLAAGRRRPQPVALVHGQTEVTYGELERLVRHASAGLLGLGLGRRDRVGVFLPKRIETVVAMFGTSLAGGVFVPINPILKAPQVGHILRDSGARFLITSQERLPLLEHELAACPELERVVVVDVDADNAAPATRISWDALLETDDRQQHRAIDGDVVALLYTSGSTGKPKGVTLSHRNVVCGALSVASYLGNTSEDRILAVLPFSFDYGFSQLSTAFSVGASVVLLEHLLPQDVIRTAAKHGVTGLAAVPPLWIQLAALPWPAAVADRLRYITNSGGAMPTSVLANLRKALPKTSVYLMYGLTEAFRSTYLPPSEIDRRPGSMGKAIPNAEILVVRPDGSECGPGEHGELVHRGSLVSLGYWNDPQRTAERFRPIPKALGGLPLDELAVWSGDTVYKDEDGYLYFVGRRDEMIKTSGYRVSPTEIEEALYSTGLVAEAVAVGVPHAALGAVIAVFAVAAPGKPEAANDLPGQARQALPTYMVPAHIEWLERLPRNANGKIDRRGLADLAAERFGPKA
jgi:acyl-CoA ligase (AMP-forming) (exosortase A-associated)